MVNCQQRGFGRTRPAPQEINLAIADFVVRCLLRGWHSGRKTLDALMWSATLARIDGEGSAAQPFLAVTALPTTNQARTATDLVKYRSRFVAGPLLGVQAWFTFGRNQIPVRRKQEIDCISG
jgi:hypothetical protein